MRILAFFAALFSGAAAAQVEAPEPEITVVGTVDREQQVREFVRALSDAPTDSPIARFDGSALCPAAFGLSGSQNSAIAARMRRVAAAAGIRVAPMGCSPNALVIVARDKGKALKWLRKKRPLYFRDAANRPVIVRDAPGAATVWHLEGLVDRSGLLVPVDRADGTYLVDATGTSLRTSAASRPIFLASIVLIEARSLLGLTTTQIADYAAMRALAETDPARLSSAGTPTILTALGAPAGRPLPVTLTQWDFAYLKALYASPAYRYAPEQRTEIGRRIRRELGLPQAR